MKYTIIIPVYHGEKTIISCLKSICQKRMPVEIIVVSDEKTEQDDLALKETIYAFTQSCEGPINLTVISNQRERGPSGARNTGLDKASGQYVWFVDCDDQVMPNWWDVWETYADGMTDVVLAGYELSINGCKTEERMCTEQNKICKCADFWRDYLQELQIRWQINPPWNKLFKRSLLQDNHIYYPENGKMGEDLCFCLQALEKAEQIGMINRSIYNYIQYETNEQLCAKFHKDKLDMIFLAWMIEKKTLNDHHTEMANEIQKRFRGDLQSYLQELMLHQNGRWKDYRTIHQKSAMLGIMERKSLTRQIKEYVRYRRYQYSNNKLIKAGEK